jgi:hypothetical protein
MPNVSFGLILVPQLYIIWRWRGIWRWLAAVPFLLIAALAVLAYLQLGPTKDWILLLQIIFYASPLWLGQVALARLCLTI